MEKLIVFDKFHNFTQQEKIQIIIEYFFGMKFNLVDSIEFEVKLVFLNDDMKVT